jgi:hypothetical protein
MPWTKNMLQVSLITAKKAVGKFEYCIVEYAIFSLCSNGIVKLEYFWPHLYSNECFTKYCV